MQSNALEKQSDVRDGGRLTTSRFVTLDLLRGIAALIVATGHYFGGFPAYLAVDFFLVLSGFILSHRYLYGKPVSFRQFVWARLARLYPLHLLTLFSFLAIYLVRYRTMPTYQDGTTATFIQHLFLLQNVGISTAELTWNAPSWSISVEFWINIAFFALITRQTPSWMLLSISVVSLAVIALKSGTLAVSLPNYLGVNSGLLRGVCSFSLGIFAYRLHLRMNRYRICTSPAISSAILLLASGLVLIPRSEYKYLDFLAPMLFLGVVVVFSVDSRRFSPWLERGAYLGAISYSIYLLHYPIYFGLRYLRELAAGTKADALWASVVNDVGGCFILYGFLVLASSHLCYKYFELPSRHAMRFRYSGGIPGGGLDRHAL